MATSKPTISASFLYETLEETLDIKPLGAKLQIGIPKETAFQENRIALSPEAVGVLVSNGNEVSIEHLAGEGSHYSDADYSEAGARIVFDRHEIYKCPILVKSAPIVSRFTFITTQSNYHFSHPLFCIATSGYSKNDGEKNYGLKF